jgi:hypothetical protein
MAQSAQAVSIRQYAAHVVPGLLQTEGYARAVLSVGRSLRSEEHLEERVAARLGRQERLRSPDCPELWVVLDEAVLRRPVGDRAVLREQLDRLLEAAAEPHVTVQVLPFDQGGHEAMGGSLTILTRPGTGWDRSPGPAGFSCARVRWATDLPKEPGERTTNPPSPPPRHPCG